MRLWRPRGELWCKVIKFLLQSCYSGVAILLINNWGSRRGRKRAGNGGERGIKMAHLGDAPFGYLIWGILEEDFFGFVAGLLDVDALFWVCYATASEVVVFGVLVNYDCADC